MNRLLGQVWLSTFQHHKDTVMNAVTRSLSTLPAAGSPLRRVPYTTRGKRHGPITRLFSPGDLGELLKPFVFLDYAVLPATDGPLFGMHPHSGIATITVALAGSLAYQDTTGKAGVLPAGGVEWMRAGAGVWHDGKIDPGEPMQAFQLWLALP